MLCFMPVILSYVQKVAGRVRFKIMVCLVNTEAKFFLEDCSNVSRYESLIDLLVFCLVSNSMLCDLFLLAVIAGFLSLSRDIQSAKGDNAEITLTDDR